MTKLFLLLIGLISLIIFQNSCVSPASDKKHDDPFLLKNFNTLTLNGPLSLRIENDSSYFYAKDQTVQIKQSGRKLWLAGSGNITLYIPAKHPSMHITLTNGASLHFDTKAIPSRLALNLDHSKVYSNGITTFQDHLSIIARASTVNLFKTVFKGDVFVQLTDNSLIYQQLGEKAKLRAGSSIDQTSSLHYYYDEKSPFFDLSKALLTSK